LFGAWLAVDADHLQAGPKRFDRIEDVAADQLPTLRTRRTLMAGRPLSGTALLAPTSCRRQGVDGAYRDLPRSIVQ
jgi:hypothetical protein